jgi:putative flippase GtrA
MEIIPMAIDHIFLKFIIVGIINTTVGAGFMFVLYNLAGFDYWVSSAANYVVGSICSFFLNKNFTFKVKGRSAFMPIAFIATIVFSYLIAYGVAKPAMYHMLANYSQKFRDNAAMLTGMCLFTGLNYIGQRFVVFGRKGN